MGWAIKITRLAKEDINEIKRWYKKKSVQAVNDFTTELTEAIETLRREDVEHRPVHNFYRKLSLKKFPYAVYYYRDEKEHAVEISAVFHNHKDETSVANRLG